MTSIEELITALCPDGVEFRALRNVGHWYGGGTPSKSNPEFWQDGTVPWLSPKDMVVETIHATGLHVSVKALEQSPLKLVPAGSVAFVVRSNVLRRRFPIALVPFDVTLNQDMRAVVPFKDVLPEYLLQACRSRAESILAVAGRTDGSMAAIKSATLLDFRIPIPPIEIQREVVAVLSRFGSLQAELEMQLQAELDLRRQQYRHYRDSILSFSERERERERVRWAPLSDLGQFVRGKRFTKADYEDSGIPCIHYGEIYTHFGTSATSVVSHLRRDIASGLRYAQPGDVVIVDVGETVEDVGKAVAWLGDEPVAIHDHSYAFRHQLNPTFVAYVMQTSWFRREKAKYIARTKVNTLLVAGFGKIEIPVPTMTEQARIVAVLDKLDGLVSHLSSDLPAEIAANRQRYEYYRDELLAFGEAA